MNMFKKEDGVLDKKLSIIQRLKSSHDNFKQKCEKYILEKKKKFTIHASIATCALYFSIALIGFFSIPIAFIPLLLLATILPIMFLYMEAIPYYINKLRNMENNQYVSSIQQFFNKDNIFSFLYELDTLYQDNINYHHIYEIKNIILKSEQIDYKKIEKIIENLAICSKNSQDILEQKNLHQEYLEFLKKNNLPIINNFDNNNKEINGNLNLKDIL